eukprot:9056481-Pyramimonas_sp.AAC.1
MGVSGNTKHGGSSDAVKGALTTVSVSCARGLTEYLAGDPKGDTFGVQEHRVLGDKLGSLQGQVKDLGFH